MPKPQPGKHIKWSVTTSGNRHQRGAHRVALTIEVKLTCEPDEAETLIECLNTNRSLEDNHPLKEHLSLLLELIADTPAKKKKLINGLNLTIYHARMANWASGTAPPPDPPVEDSD